MTAEEWEAHQDPGPLLTWLVWESGTWDERRLRLFACACVRRLWNRLDHPSSRWAVETAERFADGEATREELEQATVHAGMALWPWNNPPAELRPHYAAHQTASGSFEDAAANAAIAESGDPTCAACNPTPDWCRARQPQATLLRCVFGNPFRPFTVNQTIRTFNDAAAVKLATVIYEERDPSTGLLDAARVAILADALEEAGVDDRGALNHLRGPGPHCRGCHVVDAVLGRS